MSNSRVSAPSGIVSVRRTFVVFTRMVGLPLTEMPPALSDTLPVSVPATPPLAVPTVG